MGRALRSVINQFVAVACVLVSLFIVSATAQVSKGSISGTVLDPSGAVISGAEVRATDLATNQVRGEGELLDNRSLNLSGPATMPAPSFLLE